MTGASLVTVTIGHGQAGHSAANGPSDAASSWHSTLPRSAMAARATSKPAAAPTPAASGEGKKLSPIEMIRQQQATKTEEAPPAVAAPVAEAPKPTAPAATDGKKLSPLELIRMQGAFKGNK